MDFEWSFPIVRNVQPISFGDQIEGIATKDMPAAMEKMFNRIKEQTGYTVKIQSDGNSPIHVLFDKSRYEPDDDRIMF